MKMLRQVLCSEFVSLRHFHSNYKPSWAVTTLYIPLTNSSIAPSANNTAAPGSALLSYQYPYDSANVDQSPSYAFNGGMPKDIPNSLGHGWYVNVPDFEGPLASFTAGVTSGYATIDSVRAVLNAGFGLADNTKYAMWGYSGGAIASEWAAELQVQYAPELQFAGAALGGLVPNITSVFLAVNGGPDAVLIPNNMLGISMQDLAAQQLINRQLKTSGPYNAMTFYSVLNHTLTAGNATFASQNIWNYFKDGEAILHDPIWTELVGRDGTMGYHGTPTMPIYAYKAINDEVSPTKETDALVERYCNDGANILYQRNTVGGHYADSFNGDPGTVQFLKSVFDGSYATKHNIVGCTIQNVTVAIDTSPD